MKTTGWWFACGLALASTALAAPRSTAAQASLKDIEKTLGFVPGFLRAMPDSALLRCLPLLLHHGGH